MNLLRIGSLKVTPLVLAPMEGVTDAAFRLLCRRHGAGMTYSEMVSAQALSRKSESALRKCKRLPGDKPLAIQLFGADPQTFAESAALIKEKKLAEAIDVNAGCPDKHVMQQCAGAALLENIPLLQKIIEETVQATRLPVTVKMRTGISVKKNVAVQAALAAQEAGAKAVAVHARAASQGYSGQAEWQTIRKVKEALDIPVIGNGDVRCAQDALRMLEETGCNAVMIGRAAASNPEIFGQVALAAGKKPFEENSSAERQKAFFKEYLALANKTKETALPRLLTHAHMLARGFPEAVEARKAISCSKNQRQLLSAFTQNR
ncbi:tRNA-dihydrouridine synthase family protein [Candidatus Micrarchaeota archaeon]|nr:tRNA-dihydrouridine synthase family protein [Candidatus Micrarchaeota archaeon]